MDRRIDVAERPLVRGQLPVRVHVPLAREEQELPLGELRVDQRERDAVEGEVPGREPWVLPLVGHREDVFGVELPPLRIPPVPTRGGRQRLAGVAIQPLGLYA